MTNSRITAPPGPLARLERAGVIAVLRADRAHRFVEVSEVLVAAGIRAVEVAIGADGALTALQEIITGHTEMQDLTVGVGGVVTADQAEAAINAGAQWVISPVAAPDVVAAARIAHVPVVAGALTPTEIVSAYHGGADAVNVFPAQSVGPEYLGWVHRALPDVSLLATGGVAIASIGRWIEAGALAVGVGHSLVRDACQRRRPPARLAERARQSVCAVTEARQRRNGAGGRSDAGAVGRRERPGPVEQPARHGEGDNDGV